jgi:hypothetical protein
MRRQRRTAAALGLLAALTASSLGAVTATATAAPPAAGGSVSDRVDNWTGLLTPGQLAQLRAAGLDHEDIALSAGGGSGKTARVQVEATMSGATAARLRAAGVPLELKRVNGRTAAETPGHQAGRSVFRTYKGDNGLQAELRALGAKYPSIAKVQSLGRSVQGTSIDAVRVTRSPDSVAPGARPAVVFSSAQHAREWITPEMTRRLLRHVLERYGKNAEITRLVDTTDLYFVPVANPDGYDHTFLPGNRMWRKNLQDNNKDGDVKAGQDGVDPNRNWPTHWGYDNEGSSPDPGNDTYRGPHPASEPETQALDGLLEAVKPKFLINYHSAAELILYGAGFQVATRTPDDLVYEALVGDDARPSVPGYDPDLSAELYTTNGETTEHAHTAHDTLAFTPEMSTCETASARYRDDAFAPEDCASVFHFPDDERLVHEEVQKNLPFALAVAASAATPDNPVSVVGRTVPDFEVDSFSVSYGDPQTVAVTARRSLTGLVAKYRIGRGAVRTATVAEWEGGEVYGDENDIYFAEYRGQVSGALPGQKVEVWFEAVKGSTRVASEHFTYTLASDSGDPVLILADEDIGGVNPEYLKSNPNLRRLAPQVDALSKAGYTSDLWNTDGQGVPHPLGVLSHYRAVNWYTGLNRLTQDAEDEETETPFGPYPDVSVAERQQYLTIAVRDYLNDGGKLLHNGELAQYYGLFPFVGGLYYGANGDASAECSIDTVDGLFEDCLILADDFAQYWLGANRRVSLGGVEASRGTSDGFAGITKLKPFWNESGGFEVTSDVLPVEQFPQFESWSVGEYSTASGGSPFSPVDGEQYVGMLHSDSAWSRLTRSVTVPDGDKPAALRFQMSWNLEQSYDHVIIEARTAGQEDWTTLPDRNGGTTKDVSAECSAGFYVDDHPFLTHYFTEPASASGTCTPTGSSGEWNAFTGSSGGWKQVEVDLSAYTGKTVELSISQVTDPGTGGVGAFVDDVRLTLDGTEVRESFEASLGDWSVTGPPAGSPEVAQPWVLSTTLIDLSSAVATPRSVLLGFGLENVPDPEERGRLTKQVLMSLIGAP